MNERDIFIQALGQADAAERDAFVIRACGSDEALLARVRNLLKLHAGESSLPTPQPGELLRQFSDAPTRPQPAVPAAGTVVAGRYELQQKIGEGGMGEVWVAKQTEPVKRRVALKLIRSGLDSQSVQARFEQERQALAVMDHPSIAQVFDGGLTAFGQPFFIMELVNGLPLTKFCDEAKLTPKQRLELFVPVCLAVQHAHQKGIVHRDLKPANILVTLVDGRPVPKVIDFGIAKATGEKLTEESLQTQFGAVVGTLEYMAPEQTGYSAKDVDTRADIYALGVILYELLTGLRPIDASRLQKGALLEMIRIIREEDPSKPSTRLSTDNSLPSLAALRQTDPKKLTAMLRGELDWVVMRCLEKERDRRYETANGLARDIQRYLANEPVEARPPTKAYQFRKFLQRNKGPVLAAGLVFLVLVAGIIGTTFGMLKADRAVEAERAAKTEAQDQRENAIRAASAETAAKVQAQKDRDAAESARKEEQVQRRQAEAVAAFVCYDLLAMTYEDGRQYMAEEGGDRLTKDSTLSQLLDRAALKLKSVQGLDSRIESELCRIVGASFRAGGEPDKGIPFLEKAVKLRERKLRRDDEELLNTRNSLAVAYHAAGRTREALTVLTEMYEISRASLGPRHVKTLQYFESMAFQWSTHGEEERAIAAYEEVLKIRREEENPNLGAVVRTMSALAGAHRLHNDLAKALPMYEEALRLSKNLPGPPMLILRIDLAAAYEMAGKIDLALELYRETLPLLRQHFGGDHPHTLISLNNYGETLLQAGEPGQAVPIFEEALAGMKIKPGKDHPSTIIVMVRLVRTYRKLGRDEDAAKLQDEAFRSLKAGGGRADVVMGMNNLACELRDAGNYAQAEPLFEETIRLLRASFGPKHKLTLSCMNNLAQTYQAAGQPQRAVPLLVQISKLMDEAAGPEHVDSLLCVHNLARGYEKSGQFEKAVQSHREYAKRIRRVQSEESHNYSAVLALVAQNLMRLERWAEAEVELRQSLTIRLKTHPKDWTTHKVQLLLGDVQLRLKKHEEAGPILRACFDGFSALQGKVPPEERGRIVEVIDLLIAWSAMAEMPDELAKWRAERRKYPLEKSPAPRPLH